MNKIKIIIVTVVTALVGCFLNSPAMAKDETTKISNASNVIKEIAAIPKRKIPPILIEEASAVVIVPRAKKNDFMVSGGSAGGVLLIHDKNGVWGSPVFVRISGGTLGWQIVADPLDLILVFKERKSVDVLLKGRLVIDAKVAIESGWLGPNMKGASPKELKAAIAAYVRSHGKLVEDSTVAGTTLSIDIAANDAFYGKQGVNIADILSGKAAKSSQDVKNLQKVLADYNLKK